MTSVEPALARLRGLGLPRIRLEQLVFPAALLTMVLVGAIFYANFRTWDNLRNILTFAAIPFIIALGQTLVLIGRGVDLSVGSMVGLSGAVFARLFLDQHWPMILALLATVVVGALLGAAINGLGITRLRVSFLIVTLGTFSIFRSLANVVLHGQSLTVDDSQLDWLANGRVGPIPVLVLLAALIYTLMLFLLRGTTYGRSTYAVGANPQAARLAGINVDRVIVIGFSLCAALAALAGVLTVGQLGSAQPTAGIGFELISIASVLVGGTRLSGGYGGVTGTLVGVLFLGVLINLLLIAGVDAFWQGTASGLVLIAAVAADRSRRD